MYQNVKLVGECGAVPDEGSSTTVSMTLQWAGGFPGPVVAFYDSPGASLTGVSVDCQNTPGAIGIQYYSDDDPPGSFVNIDTLMIRGCHQGLVLGDPSNTAALSCPPPTLPIKPHTVSTNCAEADQLKFEKFRILGNPSDPAAEGIHINSADAGQGSLIVNGNFQGSERRSSCYVYQWRFDSGEYQHWFGGWRLSTPHGAAELWCGPRISCVYTNRPTVAASPTLVNDEVESPPEVPVLNVASGRSWLQSRRYTRTPYG